MGAGKEAPPAAAAGDGTGNDAEPPQPVVLRMVLHCDGCAKKVKKSIHRMPGVQSVVADAAANTVVVSGTADAAALKARIESKTHKPVEIVSAPSKAPPAEPKKNPDKGGEQKKSSPDMGGAADSKGDKAGSPSAPKEEEKGKKQPPEEKKPVEDTAVLLRIRLHCDGCADRIRRRIYKIKGVKDVILEGNAKDEVKVVGTMDVAAMVAYLNDKLNRTVELAAPGKKDGGGGGDDAKKDKGAEKQKDKSAAAAGDDAHKADKGKGVEVAGPSMASAAASMAPAPVTASTHHVSPYGYGHVAYPPPPQGPPPGYYSSGYYGGNADGAGYANPYYQQQPRADAGGYYHQQAPANADNGSYYQQQPSGGGSSGYYQQQPYQPYPFDTAPPPQMFSDENPNSCSVM